MSIGGRLTNHMHEADVRGEEMQVNLAAAQAKVEELEEELQTLRSHRRKN